MHSQQVWRWALSRWGEVGTRLALLIFKSLTASGEAPNWPHEVTLRTTTTQCLLSWQG